MAENNRIEYIDLAKGVCIILVVFMHIVPELGNGNPYLLNLRMPLYFCLSGMFFKTYGEFKGFIVKKTDRLLVPFIAWYIISYLIYYIRVFFLGHPEHIFRVTDLFLEPEFYNGSIWFLLSLFWVNILFYSIHSITKKEILRATLVVAYATVGWIWSFSGKGNFLYLGTSLTSLPFFYIGTLLIKNGVVNQVKDLKRDIITLAICGIIIFFTISLHQDPVAHIFYLNHLIDGNPLYLYCGASSMVILTFIICKYVKRVPLVSYLGRFSIIVLLTHGLIKNILTRSLAHFTGMDTENVTFHLILFSITLGLMFLIIPICKKFLPSICAQKSFINKRVALT